MTEVLFYHLERAKLEEVLPGLLEKSLERGWKAVVRAGSRERVDALDNHLWTYRDESFLPHAAGGDGECQPVWLTDCGNVPNGANILFLVDGAEEEAGKLDEFERCVMIFDGRDDNATAHAREFWTAVKGAGYDATYWKQSPQGQWQMQG